MNSVISFLTKLISESDGRLSSRRTVRLIWGLGAFVIWATATLYVVFTGGIVLPGLPESIVLLIVGTEGVTAVQRWMEKRDESKVPKADVKPPQP